MGEDVIMSETAKEVLERLKREEKTTGRSGAVPLTPKQMMLDVGDLRAKHPDKHFRWVSLKDANKLASRKAEGYTAVPESAGGKVLGDELVLMEIPREVYEQRVARQKEESARRLSQHNKDWEALAEQTAKTLRDKHGVQVSAERLIRG